MYGDLQGLNKAEVALEYGQAQVDEWRRSYDVAPPNGESLQQTQARAVKFFEAEITPSCGRARIFSSYRTATRCADCACTSESLRPSR